MAIDWARGRIVIELRPEVGAAEGATRGRLRQLLKVLLRSFGFRCVAVDFVKDEPPASPPSTEEPTK